MKKEKLFVTLLKGWGHLLLTEILSLLVMFFTGNFYRGVVAKFIIGICPIAITTGIMANYAYNVALSDLKLNRSRKIPVKTSRVILLGVSSSIPLIIEWFILLLSKLGIIKNFIVGYKLINASFFPVTDFFCHGTDVANLTYMSLIIMLIVNFIPAVTVIISYELTLKSGI